MFRRRKDRDSVDPSDEVDDDLDDEELVDDLADELEGDDQDDDLDGEEDGEAVPRPPARPTGPYDLDDAPDDGLIRLDLGSLRVPGREGMDLQVNVDEGTGVVVAVTAVIADSALQLQAFAAPRNEGIWADVRRELAAEITKGGGLADVDESDGVATLKAQVPVPQPDGKVALAAVRFIGTDGPRWLLRGVLSGAATNDPEVAAPLLEVYRGVVVVRGTEAYAPREPLPLRLPESVVGPADDEQGVGPLDISGSGQQITEIR